MKNLLRRFRDLLDKFNLLPSFSEDAVFLIAISVLSISYINETAFQELSEMLRHSTKAMVIVVAGIGFTLYTAFLTRFKTETQKHYMLWFALIVNFIIGITSFSILTPEDAWFHYIFPVLNIAAFFIVVVFTYIGVYNTSRIATKSSEYSNLLYGTLAVLVITWFYEHFFHAPWQITLSVSSAYAGMFNASIAKHLPKIFNDSRDKTATVHRLIDKTTQEMLEALNSGKLDMSKFALVTESLIEFVSVPHNQDENEYFTQLRQNRDRGEDLAIVSIGTYEWTRAWWSSTDTYLTLIIQIYLSKEPQRYEFYQTLAVDEEDRYSLNDRGLIYQGKF